MLVNNYKCWQRLDVAHINSEDLEWIYDEGRWNPAYNPENNEFVESEIVKLFKELGYE